MMLALIAGVISEVSVPSLVTQAVLCTELLQTGAQGKCGCANHCGRKTQERNRLPSFSAPVSPFPCAAIKTN